MTLTAALFSPFIDYAFMRRALVAAAAIAMGGAPLGIFLVLRRMTLVGDAISHAILPGAAIAYLFFGFSLAAMTAGGLVAGLLIALAAGALTRFSQLREDASFTGIYLISLAAGVFMISLHGSSIDLMHVLFGNVLAVTNTSLMMVCTIASVSALLLALLYRVLVVQCFDPGFLKACGVRTAFADTLFLMLLVLNLVSAFCALGTLMALSIMVLPAIAARFWTSDIGRGIVFSVVSSFLSAYVGLLLSYHFNLPSGPAIVLCAGAVYLVSVAVGPYGSIRAQRISRKHYAT